MYVRGQLSDLPEKSVEPIALEAGVAPRTLQEFLSQLKWDEDRMRDRLQHVVAAEHAGPHTIGIIDETSDVKKGDKTPGVQKQWSGRLSKTENCIVTVHLGFARGDFHCLLDGELFLPERWDVDRKGKLVSVLFSTELTPIFAPQPVRLIASAQKRRVPSRVNLAPPSAGTDLFGGTGAPLRSKLAMNSCSVSCGQVPEKLESGSHVMSHP